MEIVWGPLPPRAIRTYVSKSHPSCLVGCLRKIALSQKGFPRGLVAFLGVRSVTDQRPFPIVFGSLDDLGALALRLALLCRCSIQDGSLA